jgi:hypothetical protein
MNVHESNDLIIDYSDPLESKSNSSNLYWQTDEVTRNTEKEIPHRNINLKMSPGQKNPNQLFSSKQSIYRQSQIHNSPS